jgi:hypothetical protein
MFCQNGSVVGHEILTALTVNSSISLVLTPCSSEKSRRFGGIYRSQLQGRKASQARNEEEGL